MKKYKYPKPIEDGKIVRPLDGALTSAVPTYNKNLKIENGSTLMALFKTYYEQSLETHTPPSIPAFVTSIGVTQTTLNRLGETYPNELEFIHDCIESSLLNGALTNSYHPMFTQFVLKNKFSYNAADVELRSTTVLSDDDRNLLISQMRESRSTT